ncbi:MAG: DUF2269 domain-containing protein [Novosphingobium sp.]
MDTLILARWLHVIGACVLLGTGAGIAFFMLMAHRTRNPALIAHVSVAVVIADFLFTASAVIIQPITGIWLARLTGWPLATPWILASLALYGVTGMFWLPVVWLQWRMAALARAAVKDGTELPPLYHRYFHIWFACGFPAFSAVLAIIWLMLARPAWIGF